MHKSEWPNPGDVIRPRREELRSNVPAWQEPRIASGVLDVAMDEQLLIVCRALNPGGEWSEEGYDTRLRQKWVRTWWMAMLRNGKLVWINEAQMESFYCRMDSYD